MVFALDYLGIAFLKSGATVVLESFGMDQSRMSFFTFLFFLSVTFSLPSCVYPKFFPYFQCIILQCKIHHKKERVKKTGEI